MRRAFTLVELLIVIIVIAVLAAVVVPKLSNSDLKSKEALLKDTLKRTRDAIDRFRSDTELYPADLDGLVNEPEKGLRKDGTTAVMPGPYHGPYLDSQPEDPVSGGPLSYSTVPPEVGTVRAASGKALDGTDYADW